MANLTDPLIRAVQGSDPQNLMEYITRQKIYDSRFWKEECFGLTAADVLERAATSLKSMGGTFGGNHRPSKFLCLTLKLLQLQPDADLVQEFIQQDHFKYVKALGAFYLRLTGRPADIYQGLEPLYGDYSKLRFRGVTEWKLVHMDEFVHELLTQPFACGIALPRLPIRDTLVEEGFLDEGPRPTALKPALEKHGGPEEYLEYKALKEKSPASIALWEKRTGKSIASNKTKSKSSSGQVTTTLESSFSQESGPPGTLQSDAEEPDTVVEEEEAVPSKRKASSGKEKGKKKAKYGSLFKKDKRKDSANKTSVSSSKTDEKAPPPPQEGSEEYWNEQRAKLGLAPLK